MTDPGRTGILSADRHLPLETLAISSRRCAAGFASLGVRQGGRVALLLRNDFAFFEATQGASLLGASTVPLNWHLTAEEVAYILADCSARVLVVHSDLFTRSMQAVIRQAGVMAILVPTPEEVLQAYPAVAGVVQSDPDLEWDSWLQRFEPWQAGPVPIVGPMFYTSGTTGRPKGVQRAGNVPAEVAMAAQRRTVAAFGLAPIEGGDPPRAVMTGPLYHSAPNAYGMNVVRNGGLLVLQSRFDAAELLWLIEAHRITHLHMVPTMFVRLLALPAEVRARHDLSSLRCVVHGAAPCPPEVKRQMIDWWGPVIGEYYAMTETGIITVSDSLQWLTHPGTVGCPALGVQIRIDDDHGLPLPAGQPGEICIRSEITDYVSYHRSEAKTATLRRGGFLCTGDVGTLTEDGFLFISDRKSDMVISGGVNIYPAEIEAVLLNLPRVKDAAVFGLPDDVMGERVVAVVERSDAALTQADVVAGLRDKLASYKMPREIRFDIPLPREDSGKVKKRLLRDQWLSQIAGLAGKT
jgi:long-chain acyl-CoA synthetase